MREGGTSRAPVLRRPPPSAGPLRCAQDGFETRGLDSVTNLFMNGKALSRERRGERAAVSTPAGGSRSGLMGRQSSQPVPCCKFSLPICSTTARAHARPSLGRAAVRVPVFRSLPSLCSGRPPWPLAGRRHGAAVPRRHSRVTKIAERSSLMTTRTERGVAARRCRGSSRFA